MNTPWDADQVAKLSKLVVKLERENERLQEERDEAQREVGVANEAGLDLSRQVMDLTVERDRLADALAVAHDLLIGEGYNTDPDYRQEWQTITGALSLLPEREDG